MANPEYYFVNNNPHVITGYHEVHKKKCLALAMSESKCYLGEFDNYKDAIAKAKTMYDRVDRCTYCCKDEDQS